MTKKSAIIIYSFLFFTTLTLLFLAVTQRAQAAAYENYAMASAAQAAYDFNSNLKSMDLTLKKAAHTSTAKRLAVLCADAFEAAQKANASLSALPLSSEQTQKISKYLCVTGDYCMYVLNKCISNEVTQEERDRLKKLGEYAGDLYEATVTLGSDLQQGKIALSFFEETDGAAADSFAAYIVSANDALGGFESFSYDGKYSRDNEKRSSVYLASAKEVDEAAAKKTAAEFIGISENILTLEYENEGDIPCYYFSAPAGVGICVAKFGGEVAYMTNPRTIGNTSVTVDQALNNASMFLSELGYKNMKIDVYHLQNGILTASYVYTQDEYTCYPDSVAVGVACDNGSIVYFDAGEYLMNHQEIRDIASRSYSREDIESTLNGALTVSGHHYGIIMDDSFRELPVNVFSVSNGGGDSLRVYHNTQTGDEEKLCTSCEYESGSFIY